ncbi:MAG: bifunctional phosphoribosylaminoimidazolecarboxamide formyltransferase/IMP cyclohydrolase [Phycisphaerae bacterium]|nr:bifunctional phosphoribosylaminoimidazolecarboxamide formyltransferase/IMP cyclohydrolase [Phycisphaerae bacterium]NUQ46218.1 bifunctional phosphoribosylaminoimidazolecarboxamide formyltransferase/IMP cyclohydrolase [Phycisphaerae bacterium]
MSSAATRRALISVWDKTGLVEFARTLRAEFDFEIVSTGGTARTLGEAGVAVTLIETLTGFVEMLDGRVKTLHPAIHAGLLADRDNPEHVRQLEATGIGAIELVAVDLYPFERTASAADCTPEQAIEMIDIGGVTLLRAAAKNHAHVMLVDRPSAYAEALAYLREADGTRRAAMRRVAAARAFRTVTEYDAQIAAWIERHAGLGGEGPRRVLELVGRERLRYGENPHQSAELLRAPSGAREFDLCAARGRVADQADWDARVSYNNYLDADAALRLCAELTRAGAPLSRGAGTARADAPPRCCVFIKHNNACGVGVADAAIEAYRRAYLGDPNAAMGGVLACDFAVDADFATAVMETYDRLARPLKEAGAAHAPGGFFLEVWVAPSFGDDALRLIRGTAMPTPRRPRPPKKAWGGNVRLLAVGDLRQPPDASATEYRCIAGGMLAQSPDVAGLDEQGWRVVTQRTPTPGEMADLRLAWLICKHTRSNAISVVRDGMLIGNGAGQMSRVMSCRLATWLAQDNGHLAQAATTRGATGVDGPVAASDAFFPFRDGPDLLMDAGVSAIVQPGGGKRDEDVIRACDERGAAMIFTGTRHFRH